MAMNMSKTKREQFFALPLNINDCSFLSLQISFFERSTKVLPRYGIWAVHHVLSIEFFIFQRQRYGKNAEPFFALPNEM
mgnify:CR=1 FL=1